MMAEFLVTDLTTGATTWIAAASKREACILHENAKRADLNASVFRRGMPMLPPTAKASHDDMRVSVGDSAVLGRDRWTIR
jgi:hypothetical protein